MKKLIGIFITTLLIAVTVYAFPPTPPPTPSSSYNPAAVNETGGNITGITNFSASNLTVSGIANVTGATWQGTPTWNQSTTGNAANAAALNGHADTYFQTALTGASSVTVGNITVGSVANITSFTGTGISDSTSSTASNVAASSNAVKIAYDLANGKQTASANLTTLAGNNGANLTNVAASSVNGTVVTSNITATGGTISGTNVNVGDVVAFSWDGGSSAIGTSLGKVCKYIKPASTITSYSLVMDAVSNTTIELYKAAFNATALPTADMTGGGNVTSNAVLGVYNATLTAWGTNTTVTSGDVICANLTANNTAKRATLILHGTR